MKHLSTSDRQTLAQRLDAMKRQVLDELRSTAPQASAGAAIDAHEVHTHADDAEAEREEDLRFAEIEIDEQRLQEVERALLRLSQGSYGVCADCGDDIARERLFAQPAAIRCAACQAALEARKD